MIRSLFKHSGKFFIGLTAGKVLTTLSWIILARLFMPHEVGRVILYVTLLQITTYVADFGLNQWYMKKVEEGNKTTLFQRMLWARVLTLFLSICYLSLFLAYSETFDYKSSVIFLLSLIPWMLISITDGYYLEQKRSGIVSSKNIIATSIFLIGFFLIYVTGNADFYHLVLVYFIALCIAAAVTFPWKELRDFYYSSMREIQSILNESSAYALLIITSFAYARGDSLVIGYTLGNRALGYYGIAYKFLEGLSLFPTALTQTLFPISAKKSGITLDQLKKITAAVMAIGAIVSGLLFLAAPMIVSLILGPQYLPALPALKIFTLVLLLFFINAPLSTVVQSSDLVKQFLPFGVINTMANIFMNLWFVPIGEINAAAWVMASTECTGLLINLYFIAKLYDIPLFRSKFIVEKEETETKAYAKKATIVIVHWNTPTILRKQLTILSHEHNYQIVVIDNASAQPLSWLQKEFPHVILVHNKINRGYAAACNQGASVAVGEWTVFLNPDVYVLPDEIAKIINHAEKSNLDACSPTPDNNNYNKPLPGLLSLLVEFTPLHRIIPLRMFPKRTLTGGCLFIKSGVLRALGGWDERFFLWFEDSDLTARLTINGYKTGWAPYFIIHLGAKSFEELGIQLKKDIFFRSMDTYAKKHFGFIEQCIISFIIHRYSNRKLLPVLHKGVSITIPNLKSSLLVSFLKENEHVLQHIHEVIVVTSGLTPRELWFWRRRFPVIRFIYIEENNGFASTVNVGFRVSTGQWVGTVNDDVVMTNDWFIKCTGCDGKRVGSVNPVIYRTDKQIESAGIAILMSGRAVLHTEFPHEKLCLVANATNAAAVLYKNDALNEVGLFDEAFGSYLEDIDLSLRLKRAGYQNIVSTTAAVIHKGHATSSESLGRMKALLDFKNWILVIAKNWGSANILRYAPEIFVERLRNLNGILKQF